MTGDRVGLALPRTRKQLFQAFIQLNALVFGAIYICIITALYTGAVLLPLVLTKSYAVMVVWNWYIVPFFHTAHMTMLTAFGINGVVGLVMGKWHKPEEQKGGFWEAYLVTLLNPLIGIFIAWIGIRFF